MIHYIIIAHKSPEYITLLLDELRLSGGHVVIHIDGNISIDNFLGLENKNVHLVENRVKVNWGGFSMIKATLLAMKRMNEFISDNDHVVVMSGQDFPIISQQKLEYELKKNKEKSFIEYRIQPNKNRNILNRIIKYHFHDLVIPSWINNIFIKIVKKFYPVNDLRNQVFSYIFQRFINFFMPYKKYLINNYTIYRGSQWQILCSRDLKFIINFCETRIGKKFIKSFLYTAGPDEFFFQTLLLNGPNKDDIINRLPRYIDWKTGPGLPRILDESDFNTITKSGKRFTRKLDIQSSHKLLTLLKEGFR